MRNASVIEQQIAPVEWALCASPDYLSRRGKPAHPSDLAEHDCLVHINVTPNDRIWRFEGPSGNVSAKVAGLFFSNSALALRKAALAGLGITLVPRYTVVDELASGALVNVLPRYKPPSRPLVAVFPRVPVVPTKVQVFVDFLIKWFAERDVSRMPQHHG
jgi:DNA-binding transcriptional LysR family regulator